MVKHIVWKSSMDKIRWREKRGCERKCIRFHLKGSGVN